MIFYEAPHKLQNTLQDLYKAFGNRRISLARELTKVHEEVLRTDLEGGSETQLLHSLKRLAQLPGNYQVLPGHMDVTTLDRERKINFYIKEALGG